MRCPSSPPPPSPVRLLSPNSPQTAVTAYGSASIFHIAGALGAAWLFLWLVFGSSSPATSLRTAAAPEEEREARPRMQATRFRSGEFPTAARPSTADVTAAGHTRHGSDCSDMDVVGEGSCSDSWKDCGIPATSPDWFSFSNLALYERCSWEMDQLSTISSSSSCCCSPAPSPATGPSFPRSIASLYPRESKKTMVVWNGHHLGRSSRAPPGAPGGRSLTAYGDGRSGGSGGGGEGASADRPMSGGASGRGESCKGTGDPDSRTQSLHTSTAPATPTSIRSSSLEAHRLSVDFLAAQRVKSLLSTSAKGPRRSGCRAASGGGSDRGSAGSSWLRSGGGAGSNISVPEGRDGCSSGTAKTSCCSDDSVEEGCSSSRVGPGGVRGEAAAADARPPALREKRVDSRHLPGDCKQPSSSRGVGSGCANGGGSSGDGNNNNGDKSASSEANTVSTSMPWRAMFCSRAAWAVVIGNVGCSTAVSVVMSWQPTYFSVFLGINLEDLGLFDQVWFSSVFCHILSCPERLERCMLYQMKC